MQRFRNLVRCFVVVNIALAVPVYAYVMYVLKQAGVW